MYYCFEANIRNNLASAIDTFFYTPLPGNRSAHYSKVAPKGGKKTCQVCHTAYLSAAYSLLATTSWGRSVSAFFQIVKRFWYDSLAAAESPVMA